MKAFFAGVIGQALACAFCTLFFVTQGSGQTTAFTYQGQLSGNGVPANGRYDIRAALFATASGGTALAGPVTNSSVAVSNGLFTVAVDFGAGVFNGAARWLEMGVRPAGSGSFTTLSPRQPITAAPYAVFAGNAGTGGGSPWSLSDSNTFYNSGNVGIGTTSFGSLLTVGSSSTRGTLNVVGSSSLPPAISISDPRFTGNGSQYTIYSGLTTPGNLDIFDQNAGVVRFTISAVGSVGIGTNQPRHKLHVRGDIGLGGNGELQATAGQENLRIVRGVVDGAGNIIIGSGFSVTRSGTGDYHITFDPPFFGAPAITLTCDDNPSNENPIVATFGVTFSTANVWIRSYSGPRADKTFHFIAIGER